MFIKIPLGYIFIYGPRTVHEKRTKHTSVNTSVQLLLFRQLTLVIAITYSSDNDNDLPILVLRYPSGTSQTLGYKSTTTN